MNIAIVSFKLDTLCAPKSSCNCEMFSRKNTYMATEERFKSHKLHYVLVNMNIPRHLTQRNFLGISFNSIEYRVEILLHNISLGKFCLFFLPWKSKTSTRLKFSVTSRNFIKIMKERNKAATKKLLRQTFSLFCFFT